MNSFGNKNDEKIIFHVDVNSAFLSWSALEALKDNPDSVDLRTVPSAVGGDIRTRHGVITAKSIPAKKYGIVTGEPVAKALQKCPHLVLVKSDFAAYKKYSAAFIEILNKYSPAIEQVSIDEAYVDLTGTKALYSHLETDEYTFPLSVAYAIKKEIKTTLGFTVNVGISNNKLLAKMASDMQKPDKVHTLFPDEVSAKMWPLPIADLYGCGKSTAERLKSIGIKTIGDAANSNLTFLCSILGENSGSYIYASANGYGSSIVSNTYEEAKSYSNETTLSSDLTADSYDKEIDSILKKLSESVSKRLKRDKVYGKTVTVSVKTGNFKRHSCQMQLENSINDADKIFTASKELAGKLLLGDDGLFMTGEVIRLVGVGVTKLDDGSYYQINLFDDILAQKDISSDAPKSPKHKPYSVEKIKKLDAMTEKLTKEFGKDIIKKGSELKKK